MVFFFFGGGWVGESSHLFVFEMKMENLGGGGRTRGEPARCLDFCQVRMRTATGLTTGIWVPTTMWQLRLDQKHLIEAPLFY